MIVIPQILHVSLAKKLFDRPNNRKVHTGVVPRLGGLAFLPVLVITLGIILLIPASYSRDLFIDQSMGFSQCLPDILVLLGAMTIMFLTGLYDDLLGVKYGVKFIAQLCAAVMIVEAGVYIIDYDHLFGIGVTTDVMGKIITGFLVVYIINAFNLIDGIDGLAAGLCLMALCFFGWILFVEQQWLFSLIAWVMGGSMAVFWVFNVFGNKRRHTKIFMGDIGSLSMGVLVAFMAILVGRQPEGASAWQMRPLVLALSPLVIPMLDVVRVFCVRILHGTSPFLPDKRHIHHLMLAAGISMKSVMAVIILFQVVIVGANLWLTDYTSINFILIVDILIYALGVAVLSTLIRFANHKIPAKKQLK